MKRLYSSANLDRNKFLTLELWENLPPFCLHTGVKLWSLATEVAIKACYTLYELLFSFPAMFVTFGVQKDFLEPQTTQGIRKGTSLPEQQP